VNPFNSNSNMGVIYRQMVFHCFQRFPSISNHDGNQVKSIKTIHGN